MFIVLLRFAANKGQASHSMAAHNAWIQQGFDDGVFLVTGSLQAGQGGVVIAHNISLDDLQTRVALDPFVVEQVVAAEILVINPGRVDPRLDFLADIQSSASR